MMSETNDMRAVAARNLEEARERVRDLEGFLRVLDELTGSGHSIPTPTREERDSGPTLVRFGGGAERPAVSLADPELGQLDAAEKVLRIHLRPMKPADIAHRMLLWGFPYDKGVEALKASVGGMLARAVREYGEATPFVKVGSGLFGLREWGDATTETEQGGADSDASPFSDGVSSGTDNQSAVEAA